MTIKNRDGTTYQLNKPNPLMMTQSIPSDNIIVHTFEPDEIIINYGIETTPEPKIIEQTEVSLVPKGNQVPAFCHLADLITVTDPIYQDMRTKTVYGKKFSFNTIIMSESDLMIQLWATNQEITPDSVIMIPLQKRWWKVSEIEEYGDGVMLICLPSELKPIFD